MNHHPAPKCCWCGWETRTDLRPFYTSWGALAIECVSDEACNARAWEGGTAFMFEGRA